MTEQQTQNCETDLAKAIHRLNEASHWLHDLAEEGTSNKSVLMDIRYLRERCLEVADECLAVEKER